VSRKKRSTVSQSQRLVEDSTLMSLSSSQHHPLTAERREDDVDLALRGLSATAQ
jgi:hypothetical protein